MSERTPEEHPVTEPIPPQPEQESPEPEEEEEEEKEENKEPRPAAKGGQTMKTLALAAAAAMFYGSAAMAVPLTGEVSINGPDNYTQTQVNFTGPGNLQGESGSFTVLGTCTSCVTMASSLTASSSEQLFTSTNMGHTVTLTIQAPNTFVFNPNSNPALDALDVSGSGTLSLDGNNVAGFYSLTTQGPISTPGETIDVTFSATAVPTTGVPEPTSLAMLGSALLMLGFWWRRRQS